MGPRIPARSGACRRSRCRRAWATLAPALLLVLCGCTTTIVPPVRVADPQPVFVLDHGRHTSLVLPHPDGLVRYAYGDWRWYALEDTGVSQGMAALLWPTQGTLGRRVLAGPVTEEGVRRSVGVVIEHLYMVQADGARVDALREKLEELFIANRATRIYSAASDLEFVPHPDGYSAFNNSNHMLADWLEALGCDIRGSATFARWELAAPRSWVRREGNRERKPAPTRQRGHGTGRNGLRPRRFLPTKSRAKARSHKAARPRDR